MSNATCLPPHCVTAWPMAKILRGVVTPAGSTEDERAWTVGSLLHFLFVFEFFYLQIHTIAAAAGSTKKLQLQIQLVGFAVKTI